VILRITNETGLEVRVRHLPPGISQWNKIEHRMVAYITPNGRGRPLLTHEVIVNLMGSTTPQKGLRIKAELDPRKYEHGIKVMELSDLPIGKNTKLTKLFFRSCLCRSLHDEG
jgi:DDE family transposase